MHGYDIARGVAPIGENSARNANRSRVASIALTIREGVAQRALLTGEGLPKRAPETARIVRQSTILQLDLFHVDRQLLEQVIDVDLATGEPLAMLDELNTDEPE
jgi:hypothetical protein